MRDLVDVMRKVMSIAVAVGYHVLHRIIEKLGGHQAFR